MTGYACNLGDTSINHNDLKSSKIRARLLGFFKLFQLYFGRLTFPLLVTSSIVYSLMLLCISLLKATEEAPTKKTTIGYV